MAGRLSKSAHKAFILIVATFVCGTIEAQQDTTLHGERRNLHSVVISLSRRPSVVASQTPTQVVDAERIERTGALLLSDALRSMSGLTIKDYGGVGGIKTVSARGLGSQFSTLSIDGVAVNDCQNGQVDLGRYMVGNSAYISFSNGEQDALLLSARATAAGSIINMETLRPSYMPGEHNHASVSVEAGSFGHMAPTLSFDHKFSQRFYMSLWTNYLKSNGNYPFRLYYTTSHTDSSSVERRQHSQMHLYTGDLNFFYTIASDQNLTAKIHYVSGHHALPGPVVYYASRGTENTYEQLLFAQVKYKMQRPRFSAQIIGKYQHSTDTYEDSAAQTATRYLRNDYRQDELYQSSSLLWKPTEHFSASISTDGAVSTLVSNLEQNNVVNRLTSLSVATLQYSSTIVNVKGNILGTLIEEHASDVKRAIRYRRLSPYAGVSVRLAESFPLRLRYFFKETYRVPSFNEMYYFTLTRDLKPEKATQHNVGLSMRLQSPSDTSTVHTDLSFTADAYINNVKDKIIAIPTQNMFLWSMINLGEVRIAGLDINVNSRHNLGRLAFNISVAYTYQNATDRTDSNSKTYGHQIPYTPRHSGNVTLDMESPWINFSYTCMAVGERFYKRQNSDNTRLPAYTDHGITASHTFELPIGTLTLQGQVLNIFNKQYEVVRSYPMMGRNYRIKITYNF